MKKNKSLLLLGISTLLLVSCTNNTDEESGLESTEKDKTEEVGKDKDNNEDSNDSFEEYLESIENEFDGKVIEVDDFTIKITDYKVIKAGEDENKSDKDLLGFWFDVTLNEDAKEEYDSSEAWLFTFEASQGDISDLNSVLNVGAIPNKKHEDVQNKSIKPGETVSSSISYELKNLKDPVQLIAYSDLLSGEIYGVHEYSLD